MFNSLEGLRVFVQIFEKKSLSAVAELNLTSPGVISKRLSQIENEFGARLFHRTTRSIQPTDEGQRLYSQALHILETVDDYENEWGEQTDPSGLIRITASASFARIYLTRLLLNFSRKYPKIKLSLELSDKVLDIVAEGIDIAIRGAQLADSSLVAKPLGPSPEVLCATKEYLQNSKPLNTPSDLVNHNCIVLNENYNWEFEVNGKTIHQKVNGNFQTNYSEALVDAVKDGLGLGMICYWQVHEELMRGELQHVLPEFNPGRRQTLYAVYPSRRHLPTKTKLLINYLETELKLPVFKAAN
ncbi:MAG TPA: LysR family transcriptional regulator [Methylophilus sp.]